jgi:hypothetical protein
METGQGRAEDVEGSLLAALFASAFDALEYIFDESVVLWIVLQGLGNASHKKYTVRVGGGYRIWSTRQCLFTSTRGYLPNADAQCGH